MLESGIKMLGKKTTHACSRRQWRRRKFRTLYRFSVSTLNQIAFTMWKSVFHIFLSRFFFRWCRCQLPSAHIRLQLIGIQLLCLVRFECSRIEWIFFWCSWFHRRHQATPHTTQSSWKVHRVSSEMRLKDRMHRTCAHLFIEFNDECVFPADEKNPAT